MAIIVFLATLFIYLMIFVALTFASYHLYLEHYKGAKFFSLNYMGALATDVLLTIVIVRYDQLFQERFFLEGVLNEWVFLILFFGLPTWLITIYYIKPKTRKIVMERSDKIS